jgi:hypothetical protein
MFPEKLVFFEYERPDEIVNADVETSLEHLSILDQPTCPPISEITPLSVYEYYLECCTVGKYEPLPKLVDQLEGADQLVDSLDLSGRNLSLLK